MTVVRWYKGVVFWWVEIEVLVLRFGGEYKKNGLKGIGGTDGPLKNE